jgi:Ca2+-binding EF-hand superfamily protein
MVILDYASRGFGGSPAEVKRALLEWVNKKTEGYENVNPPGVKNFSTDWRSGLAWCALIHRHRPELIDYQQCLGQSNAENLEMAFSIAEEHIDIPRLLDVEDVDVPKPDDKSVLTYVMEYFNAFAGDALREAAAKQAAEWLNFLRSIFDMQNDYERRARELLAWAAGVEQGWSGFNFGDSKREADAAFDQLRNWVGDEKPGKEQEKMDCEALFTEIQATLSVNNLTAYQPPDDASPDALQGAFDSLNAAQSKHGRAVRDNKNRFIERKEDNSAEEALERIRESFNNYDKNNSGTLNKVEFQAATMEMGIVMKTQEEKDNYFNNISGGNSEMSFEQYAGWVQERVTIKMDSPDAVKQCFSTLAGGRQTLTPGALMTQPLTDEDRQFLQAQMATDADGNLDYSGFVDRFMKA